MVRLFTKILSILCFPERNVPRRPSLREDFVP